MKAIVPIIFIALALPASAEVELCSLHENFICSDSTTTSKVGVLENGYIVYNYTHVWGQAFRASNRIVVTSSSGAVIGIYAPPELASGVEGSCIKFSTRSENGNTICLNDGQLPTTALVDGTPFDLMF